MIFLYNFFESSPYFLRIFSDDCSIKPRLHRTYIEQTSEKHRRKYGLVLDYTYLKPVFGFYLKSRRDTQRRRGEPQRLFSLCGSSRLLRVSLRNMLFEDKHLKRIFWGSTTFCVEPCPERAKSIG